MKNYLDELQEIWDNALAKEVMNYQASKGDVLADSSLKFEKRLTESQYNNFGWVRYNDVLSPEEYSTLLSRYADYKHNKDSYPTTKFKEAVIYSFDYPNIIMYVRGPIRNPEITMILKIDSALPLKLQGEIQKEIIDNERRKIPLPYKTTSVLFEKTPFLSYKKRDFGTYSKYLEGQRKGANGKEAIQTDRTLRNRKGNAGENKDSLGNPLSQEQSEYFKKSKVRDKNGNLLVVYHGSASKFTIFDPAKIN